MTIFMCKKVCITNRKLVYGGEENFLRQLKYIIDLKPEKVILREKDLSETEYETLAEKVIDLFKENNYLDKLYIHYYPKVAIKLGISKIHLPLHIVRTMQSEEKSFFDEIGASTHSTDDALEAQKLGCSYITAGHIFTTDCKKGLEPRGLDFLKSVCDCVDIPVYAIGGINDDNMISCIENGAAGVCSMSGFMKLKP